MSFKEARKKAGLTQAQVGDALGVTGAAVVQWEKGQTRPRASLLVKIAQLYCCTVDDLLQEEASA